MSVLLLLVYAQPWFAFVERTVKGVSPYHMMHKQQTFHIPGYGQYKLTVFKLLWRTTYVCIVTCELLLLMASCISAVLMFGSPHSNRLK